MSNPTGRRKVHPQLDFYGLRAPHGAANRLRLRREGLIEEFVGGRVTYGDWDRLFGCWLKLGKAKAKEIIPTWPILSETGAPLDAARVSATKRQPLPEGCSSSFRPGASKLFYRHFDRIPAIVRRLAAPLGRHQWLALYFASEARPFWRFLWEINHRGELGYLYGCLALAERQGLRSRKARREFAEQIVGTSRRRFLSSLAGRACARRHVKALEKLEFIPSYNETDVLLYSVDDEASADVLRHATRISRDLAEAAQFLPSEILHTNITELLSHVSLARIEEEVEVLSRELPASAWADAARNFADVRTRDQFFDWCDVWEERVAHYAAWPAPPLDMGEGFRPITSYRELCREGRAMFNCVATYWQEVVNGEVYFYHFEGEGLPDEHASVAIALRGQNQWGLLDALGKANAALHPVTYGVIQDRLANANSDKLRETRALANLLGNPGPLLE